VTDGGIALLCANLGPMKRISRRIAVLSGVAVATTCTLVTGLGPASAATPSSHNWGVSRILDRFSVVDQAAAAAVRYSLRASCGVR